MANSLSPRCRATRLALSQMRVRCVGRTFPAQFDVLLSFPGFAPARPVHARPGPQLGDDQCGQCATAVCVAQVASAPRRRFFADASHAIAADGDGQGGAPDRVAILPESCERRCGPRQAPQNRAWWQAPRRRAGRLRAAPEAAKRRTRTCPPFTYECRLGAFVAGAQRSSDNGAPRPQWCCSHERPARDRAPSQFEI